MKKLVSLIAILALATPMFAATVSVYCVDDVETGWVNIYWDAGSDEVSGFGLDITAVDANIIGIKDLDTDYWVFPGTIEIVDGNIVKDGNAIAPATDKDALGGLCTGGSTIEMAALYASGATPPDSNGLLCKIKVDQMCTLNITTNDTRGGVVMKDANAATVAPSSCNVYWAGCQGCGDATGDFMISPADGVLLSNAWINAVYDARVDFNRTGPPISPADGVILSNSWISGLGCNQAGCLHETCP